MVECSLRYANWFILNALLKRRKSESWSCTIFSNNFAKDQNWPIIICLVSSSRFEYRYYFSKFPYILDEPFCQIGIEYHNERLCNRFRCIFYVICWNTDKVPKNNTYGDFHFIFRDVQW